MNSNQAKQLKRIKRHRKIRAKVKGASDCPRLSVFRSNRSMNLQLIDDDKNITLASAHSREITKKDKKVAVSFELGKKLAEKAKAKGIEKVVFDRGGYKYHGRTKQAAEGAREGGLKF
jgi:large subunit ribosomal protein L18